MDAWCPYSGVSYAVQHFGAKTKLISPHPIFHAPLKLLIAQAGKWASGSLTENERRLLFLSLLHNTGHVDFQATAEPSDSIVQLNMEKLLSFVNWSKNVENPQLTYARFVIRSEHRYLEHVRHWLDAWHTVKEEWQQGAALIYTKKKLADKEAALERLIKSSLKTTDDYAGRLADWAFEASNTPMGIRAYWKDLFRLKGFDIVKASSVDLDELLEHMECNLEVYNSPIHSNTVLRHIRTLVAKNRAGIEWWLGAGNIGDDGSFSSLSNAETTFTIIDNETKQEKSVNAEEYNKEVAINNYAPTDGKEPQKQDYPDTVSYMRAKAAYVLLKNKEKQASSSPFAAGTQNQLALKL